MIKWGDNRQTLKGQVRKRPSPALSLQEREAIRQFTHSRTDSFGCPGRANHLFGRSLVGGEEPASLGNSSVHFVPRGRFGFGACCRGRAELMAGSSTVDVTHLA